MFGLVKKLFGGILAFIGSIFSFGKNDKKLTSANESSESKVVEAQPQAPENKKQPKAQKQAKPEAAFFLEAEDARGYASANGKSAANPQKAKKEAAVASTTASALNLPAPTVSSAPADSAPPFVQFARRRPGANMSAFLDMAKQVKTSN